MTDPMLGEIRMFAGTFAPRHWAFCNGQILPIADFGGLFSLYGTIYGGNGRNSFGIPDMRGRIPLHQGQGAGLTFKGIGQAFGQAEVILAENEMPIHNHTFNAFTGASSNTSPIGGSVANVSAVSMFYKKQESPYRAMGDHVLRHNGASDPHENRMPFLALSFIVCIEGAYPSRN